jgi:hypothetical protein
VEQDVERVAVVVEVGVLILSVRRAMIYLINLFILIVLLK